MDGDGFDNVAWKLRMKAMSITADPNIFKLVEIPVSVVGEVSGTVMMQKASGQEGLGRIILNIFGSKGNLAGHTMTEQDGYFSYLGLAPGDYEIGVDTAQISKLSLAATPVHYPFNIKVNRDGDIIDGKDFLLKSTLPDTISAMKVAIVAPTEADKLAAADRKVAADQKAAADRQTEINNLAELDKRAAISAAKTAAVSPSNLMKYVKIDLAGRLFIMLDPVKHEYYVQTGAFKKKEYAENLATSYENRIPCSAGVVFDEGYYKVRFGPFKSSSDYTKCVDILLEKNEK